MAFQLVAKVLSSGSPVVYMGLAKWLLWFLIFLLGCC